MDYSHKLIYLKVKSAHSPILNNFRTYADLDLSCSFKSETKTLYHRFIKNEFKKSYIYSLPFDSQNRTFDSFILPIFKQYSSGTNENASNRICQAFGNLNNRHNYCLQKLVHKLVQTRSTKNTKLNKKC